MSTSLKSIKLVATLAGGLVLGAVGLSAQAQTSWSSNPMAQASEQAASQAAGVYSTQRALCPDCGQVTAVNVTEKAGESNAVGLIAGGVAGAVLGHQIGGGFGKDLATIAGAAGGAFAGKKIQENMNASKVWTVSVQYPDGRNANFTFEQDPGLSVGTQVRNSGNTVVRN